MDPSFWMSWLRCPSVASPSGGSRMVASEVLVGGGLGSLGSARTGEACAEGVSSSEALAWAEGAPVSEGSSSAGLDSK